MLLNIIDFGARLPGRNRSPRFRLYEDTRMQIETPESRRLS